MSNDKTLARTVTDDEVIKACTTMDLAPNVSTVHFVRRALEQFAAGREGWHSAILAECATIGACYQESDPTKTVRDLIEYHRKDAVWHHEQEAGGRVAASPAPVQSTEEPIWSVWERLPGWLIDHCEGEVISEEFLQFQVAKMLQSPPFGHAASKFALTRVAEPAPPETQSRKLDADVAAQNYCRSMWGAARGYPDWRRYHDAFVAGYMAKPVPAETAQPVAQKADAEPVAVVGDNFSIYWAGSGPIAPLIERHGIKAGAKLYITPQAPAPTDAERLDAKRWQAFRSRDGLDTLQATDFLDAFLEDADSIIDAAMAAKDAA